MLESFEDAQNKEVIYLTLLNGTGYIFNIDDYMTLRMRHRIIGALVGTTSSKGWSASECTMPVELTPCETRLLLELGIAKLVSKQKSLLKEPSSKDLATYKNEFESRIAAQSDALKNEKLREAERNINKIMIGKRKKLLKEGLAEQAEKLKPADVLQEIAENLKFERRNALLEIPCAHVEMHTAEVMQICPDDSLKYRVFRDFWQRGKFVTAGDAFGADFLIYPGDPLLYHASHIVILHDSTKLNPLDMIAKVRLSVIVNKLCVFAYLKESKDRLEDNATSSIIHYQTISWEGNRDKKRSDTNIDE